MTSGYSKTSLAKKLGLKKGFSFVLYNEPKHYLSLFEELPGDIERFDEQTKNQVNFIHLFCTTTQELNDAIKTYKPLLKIDGLMWVSWPKGSSKIHTDLKRELVRDMLLKAGLVDVKVAAIDEDWSGLKFVYRLKDRH